MSKTSRRIPTPAQGENQGIAPLDEVEVQAEPTLKDRIEAIERQIEEVVNDANRTVAFLNGQLSILKELAATSPYEGGVNG